MRYLSGEEVASTLADLIHQGTQQHDYETDLTVSAVFRVTGKGALDFGGSEYKAAAREGLEPQKASPDDQYGWWDLLSGSYIGRFNESVSLTEDQIAFVQPHERLLLAGGFHPPFHFRGQRETLETLLTVGQTGLRVKENARFSKLLIVQISE